MKLLLEIIEEAKKGHACVFRSDAPALEEGVFAYQNHYYLQRNWVYETQILQHLQRLCRTNASLPVEIEDAILNPEQKCAVEHMFSRPFSVICGGPGTGKTYTAGIFVQKWISQFPKCKVVVAAPTGKAALHLHASLLSRGVESKSFTLHRLLQLRPRESNLFDLPRIDADLVIVDEASMIDLSLFAHLLGAIGNKTRLIVMGDPNQLPPVGEVGIFSALAELFGVFLRRCMRTEEDLLRKSAESILHGDFSAFLDVSSFAEMDPDTLVDTLYEKIAPSMAMEKEGLQTESSFRALNALRQGPLGLEVLNQKILEKMNEKCPEGWWWAAPVLATKNIPHWNIYNGSNGWIIGRKKGKVRLSQGTLYFDGKEILGALPFELGFVISVHKSQGSEFDEVLALFPPGSENFGKEALYTAATRAKKKWGVIGSKESLQKIFLQNLRPVSGLVFRWREMTLAQKG